MKLLHIDSSISGEGSASRQLSAATVAAFKAAVPGFQIIRRDLDAAPIPHLDPYFTKQNPHSNRPLHPKISRT